MNLSKACLWFLCAAIGLATADCGKKKAPEPVAGTAPDGTPRATPRQYVVKGQIDLEALTQTLREYVRWKGQIPTDFKEVITSGFLTNALTPPPGKRFVIVRFGIGYQVELDDQ